MVCFLWLSLSFFSFFLSSFSPIFSIHSASNSNWFSFLSFSIVPPPTTLACLFLFPPSLSLFLPFLFHFPLSLSSPSVSLSVSLTRSLPVCLFFFSFSPFLFSPSISLFFLPLLSLALYIIQRLLFLLNTAGELEICQREQRGALLVLTYCKATLKGSPDWFTHFYNPVSVLNVVERTFMAFSRKASKASLRSRRLVSEAALFSLSSRCLPARTADSVGSS